MWVTGRLNARIGYKKDISHLMNEASSNDDVKSKLFDEIAKTKSFVKKIRILLIEDDIADQHTSTYLKEKLDKIFNSLDRNNFRRTFQDFYILWFIISPISLAILKKNRHEIASSLTDLIQYSKNIPEEDSDGRGYLKFIDRVESFHKSYALEKRKITLSEEQIKELIVKQRNICPISKTSLYWGDEVEVDHIEPLAVGGKDEHSNLQVVHKDSNRSKGIKTV